MVRGGSNKRVGRRGRGPGGHGGDAPRVTIDGDESPIATDVKGVSNLIWYERSQERFTWNGVTCSHMKRIKILPQARDRDQNVSGSCVYYAIATALEAANRISGVEVDELAWEELHDKVDKFNPCRVTVALRVLKYHGIHKKVDYKKRNFNGKRFKISQFYEFCNVDIIEEDVPSGLDRNNIEAAINNMLSRTVMLAHFPISKDYCSLSDGGEHIYKFDKDDLVLEPSGGIPTHVAVVTGFGFEESTPYFEFLDCNGEKFGKKGFGRILPSSIISLYGFDIIAD
ncbi:hypothetical protein BS78_05G231900 [Paspalum vaginatum]|nr:hypothetical protein BS78_05G231900 [Paspalum vaginatum]